MYEQFLCNECGIKRYAEDLSNELKDGCGLCRFCNTKLEIELGRGVREYIPPRICRVQ